MARPAHSNDSSIALGQRFKGPGGGTSSWFTFWSRPEGIHICQRHLEARYRCVASEFLAAFPDAAGKSLLDYGCGEALESRRLAQRGIAVVLYDRSDYFRQRVERRFEGAPGIRILDDSTLAGQAPASLDYILVCSVIQYLSPAELEALLGMAHTLLKPGGTLVLADIIPKSLGTFADVVDFLLYSARHRFFFSGLRTLFDMVATDYRAHLQHSHLVRYDLDALSADLGRHGFQPRRAARNIGISRARRTLLAVKPEPAAS